MYKKHDKVTYRDLLLLLHLWFCQDYLHIIFFLEVFRKSKIRKKRQLNNALELNFTSLWYESPNRLAET